MRRRQGRRSGYPSTRAFTSFAAAAEQAARSRIRGGIRLPMGVEVGEDQGRAVGQLVRGYRPPPGR